MSSISSNTNSNIQTFDVMTPNEILLGNSKNGVSDSDDDVVGNTGKSSNHNSYTSILALTCSTNQEEKHAVLNRDQLTPHDVILGRGGHDKGPYADALQDWWPKYNAGTHSTKRIICRDAIKDMHSRGVRFINRVEDGSRHGYYDVEPQGSARVERKVLRCLRQEVLNSTVRRQFIKKAELTPAVAPLPIIVQPEKANLTLKPKGPKKARVVKSKEKLKKKHSNVARKKKFKKPVSGVTSYSCQDKSKYRYIPILPASLRPQENVKIAVPPPLTPPRLSSKVPPPALRKKDSLGSVTGTKNEPNLPLIPSAINFGTSDLVPRNNNGLFIQPQVVATSPDTVLATDYLSFLNSSFGMGMMQQGRELMQAQPVPQSPLKSTALFDFNGIFDDASVDYIMNDIDTTICPPALTGRQSSIDRKSTRLNSSHSIASRMPSSA